MYHVRRCLKICSVSLDKACRLCQSRIPRFIKAFTLIELLVVFSIISLLSSIVLASLQGIKLRARDTAVKSLVRQLVDLSELEKLEIDSYAPLQINNYFGRAHDCAQGALGSLNQNGNQGIYVYFYGTYADQAKKICENIFSFSGYSPYGPGMFLWVGFDQTQSSPPPPDTKNNYSFAAYLPGKGTFFCIGSSGRNSDTTTGSPLISTAPGCPGNP